MCGTTTAQQQEAERTTRQTAWLILDDEQSTVDLFWQQLLQMALAPMADDVAPKDANAGETTASHAVEPSHSCHVRPAALGAFPTPPSWRCTHQRPLDVTALTVLHAELLLIGSNATGAEVWP